MRIAALTLLLLAPFVRGEELRLDDVFERTAEAPPVRYALGRDVLFAAGEDAAALARAHADDPDPGRRFLARLLRLRLEHPERVAVWREALHAGSARFTSREATVRFRRFGAKGQLLEWREVPFSPVAVPVVIDALRSGKLPTAARVAGALRAADTIPFLVAWLGHDAKPFEDALVAIGAAPPVRPVLEDEDPFRVASAARVLGGLRDAAAADALLRIVRTSKDDYGFPAAADALRAIDPVRGADALVDRLLAPRANRGPSYLDVRAALVAYGPVARAAVARRRPGAGPVVAAILDGITWELADPARAAAAYKAIGERDGDTFHGYDDPEDAGRIVFWMRNPAGPAPLRVERAAASGEPDDLLWLLDADPVRGPAIARAALLDARRHGDEPVLAALAIRAPAAALDVAEALRPREIDRYVAALLLLVEDARTRAVLERAPDSPVARAALAGTPTDLLAHGRKDVALAAARALARRGDAAGVPFLAGAAAAARGPRYRALRDDLVRAGRPPDATDAVERRVLRAAVAARLADPARARAVDEALARAQPRVYHILGAQPHHYEHAGHALADALGAGARPLLEEAALFLGDLVAIHALGKLAADASIPVLLRVARTAPGPASRALRAMGEKGIAAARAVPPPNPARGAYPARASRHVAAADALVGADGGIEKVLEGLAGEPADDREAWARRQAAYLAAGVRAAGKGPPDPRLLEPALRLLREHGPAHGMLREACLEALGLFSGERVARATLPWLPQNAYDSDGGRAYRALVHALGDGAAGFVHARYREAPHPRLLHTLARLAGAPTATRDDRDRCAALLRETGTAQAALDLLALHVGRPEAERDDRDRAAVLAYVAGHGDAGPLARRLAEANLPGAGDALLQSYRRGGDGNVLIALGEIGYEPAAADVHAAAKRWAASERRPSWAMELRTLPRLGATGRRMAREFLAAPHPLDVRAAAASALAQVRDEAAFDAIVGLLDELEPAADMASRKRLSGLVWAAAEAAPARAHAELVRRSLVAPEPLRDLYADAAATIRGRHPDVAASLPAVDGR